MRGLMVVTGVALIALTGCVANDGASRSQDNFGHLSHSGGDASSGLKAGMVQMPLAVQDVKIVVPRTLRVSEAEVYYPIADIVWRGEPRGDRYQQVEAIYQSAAASAIAPLQTGLPVVAEVEVLRFHCVTDKTRYSVGGTHSLKFLLTIRDARTGQVLSGPRKISADIKAVGGRKAVAEDYAGITQKATVTAHLTEVLRQELSELAVDPALVAAR